MTGRWAVLFLSTLLEFILVGCGSSAAPTPLPTATVAASSPTFPSVVATTAPPTATTVATPRIVPTLTPTPPPATRPPGTPTPVLAELNLLWVNTIFADTDDLIDIIIHLKHEPGIISGNGNEFEIIIIYDPTLITPEKIQRILLDLGHQTKRP